MGDQFGKSTPGRRPHLGGPYMSSWDRECENPPSDSIGTWYGQNDWETKEWFRLRHGNVVLEHHKLK